MTAELKKGKFFTLIYNFASTASTHNSISSTEQHVFYILRIFSRASH